MMTTSHPEYEEESAPLLQRYKRVIAEFKEERHDHWRVLAQLRSLVHEISERRKEKEPFAEARWVSSPRGIAVPMAEPARIGRIRARPESLEAGNGDAEDSVPTLRRE